MHILHRLSRARFEARPLDSRADVARCCRPGCLSMWKRVWSLGYVLACSNGSLGPECKETGRGDETPLPARAYHALEAHQSQPLPKNAFTRQKCTKGKGAMQRPHPKASTIYNDDVSSGPRPQAHWYMLTHRAASMRLPNGPRIALH